MPNSTNKMSVLVCSLRKKAGFTQSELAQKGGISFRTMQRIESGEVSPRIDLFFRIIRSIHADLTHELVELFKSEGLDSENSSTESPLLDAEAINKQWNELGEGLIWRDSYLTGYSTIDFQHKHIFEKWQEAIKQIREKKKSTRDLSLMLAEIIGSVKLHFESEMDEFSQKSFAPKLMDAHEQSHLSSLVVVQEYQKSLSSFGPLPTPRQLAPVVGSFIAHVQSEAHLLKEENPKLKAN